MRRPDTYSVSVGPAAYEYAKRVAEQTMRDNAKLGLTFEELAVALVLRGVALSAQAEPQPRRTRGYLGATVDGGIDDHDEPPAAPDDAALVERLRDAGAGEESGSHTHRAIFDAIDRIAALTAERDAVVRQMQTFNVVVQERDAKIVAATERAERAEGREKALREDRDRAREALRSIAAANPRKWEPDVRDQFQEWAQNIARAALAEGKE